jgi:hypothetical protein
MPSSSPFCLRNFALEGGVGAADVSTTISFIFLKIFQHEFYIIENLNLCAVSNAINNILHFTFYYSLD